MSQSVSVIRHEVALLRLKLRQVRGARMLSARAMSAHPFFGGIYGTLTILQAHPLCLQERAHRRFGT